jgi:hypothetical protein
MPTLDLFNPTPEHALLRQTVRDFAREQVEPQALQANMEEPAWMPSRQ